MYTNGNGFIKHQQKLLKTFIDFNLSWIELSRHHYDEAQNQYIMRFQENNPIILNSNLNILTQKVTQHIPIKLICIIQKNGIDTADKVNSYLEWASSLGIKTVVFRELSKINSGYKHNNTFNYIQNHRVTIDQLLDECLHHTVLRQYLSASHMVDGYYFWNIHFDYQRNMNVVFECSDYDIMHECHNEKRIYKLIYFANGQLCADWTPNNKILMEYHHE